MPEQVPTATLAPAQGGTVRPDSVMRTGRRTARVLVIDDDPGFRTTLARLLGQAGYEASAASTARTGLETLRRDPPDLVLLDVGLPDRSGVELLSEIRATFASWELPVLLVSGESSDRAQLEAFDRGADDFIAKPVSGALILAKVNHMLYIKQMCEQLEDRHEQALSRNAELLELERAKETLMHMLVHDLKSPLGALELGVNLLRKLQSAEASELGSTTLQNIGACANKLSSMVQNILIVAQMERTGVRLEPTDVSLGSLAESNGFYYRSLASSRSQSWLAECPEDLPRIRADLGLISRVIDNLVANACRVSPQGSEILMRIEKTPEGGVLVSVGDRGPGVPEDMKAKIFEKFVSASDSVRSHGANQGLGLTFSKLAVEGHGGRIWVESRPGGGSLFCFSLPPFPPERQPSSSRSARECTP